MFALAANSLAGNITYLKKPVRGLLTVAEFQAIKAKLQLQKLAFQRRAGGQIAANIVYSSPSLNTAPFKPSPQLFTSSLIDFQSRSNHMDAASFAAFSKPTFSTTRINVPYAVPYERINEQIVPVDNPVPKVSCFQMDSVNSNIDHFIIQ